MNRTAAWLAALLPAVLACTGMVNTSSRSDGSGTGGSSGSGPLTCEDVEAATVAPRLYRLSTEQLANALRDLLDLTEAPSIGGDTEAAVSFYPRSDAPVQAGLAAGFSAAVRKGLDSIDIATRTGCGQAADPAACAHAYLEGFAARAYRRPLEQADREALYLSPASPFVVGAAVSVDNGIRLTLEAILQAPSFVYRREFAATPDHRLDGYETATQLAFMLGNTAPDDELWQAAQNGELATNEQIEAQIDRLLLKPEVQASVTHIVGAWFGLEKVLAASKDPTAFPGFTQDNIQQLLFESGKLFINDVLWSGSGSLTELLTSPRVYVNDRLASIYGVASTGSDPAAFVAVDLPNERAGIMTQPAIMAAYASSLDTSVVKRGLFVIRKALCLGEPPPPSPAILALAAMQAEDHTTTERQKAEYRAMNTCAGCHSLFDPYGLALESYDAIGRFRTIDKNGQPLDASSDMPESVVLPEDERAADVNETEPIENALEFVSGVARTNVFALCGNRQMLSYAVGRDVEMSCLDQKGISSEMTLRDILKKVLLSDLARKRVAEGAP